MLDVEFVTKEAVIETNRRITQIYGDPHGVISEGNLEYVVESVKNRFNNKEEHESMVCKAALLLDLIANKSHMFVEGNKRTSISACATFLELNGYSLKKEPDEAEFVLSVARDQQTVDSIAKWLKQRIIRIETHKG